MMINKTSKSCLLIVPTSFYSYSEHLKQALTLKNYNVVIANHEYPENTFGKIMGKLGIPLLLRMTKKKIIKKFIKNKSYDLVIIVKGRGMSTQLIEQLKRVSTKVVSYTFDSFKYHPAPLRWYKQVDNFYTFDYRDAQKHDLQIIELFSSMPESSSAKKINYQISAIVRNHSDRLKYISSVLNAISEKEAFIYIYEQNIILFLQNFIKNPFLYIRFWKYISFKSLPYEDYIRILRESNFTIDFAHPSQTGITIRCFEALSSQTKIITNNSHVRHYKYFNSDNTILFDPSSRPDSLLEHFERIRNIIPETHHRTINHFVDQLIELDKKQELEPVKFRSC
ncbi:hypothetical protein [Autumnicola musiva]|uniref:Uncharacterized protein n=1 Tax=Autumnicola musiva TaxID=3075589 RepID=A0ABU3D8I3_9FLAO|nr:hypothetical protein [Zunongwangia sp. F117]MDT0677689.1 hypothetical protein [Zunongwangia sp. F117]